MYDFVGLAIIFAAFWVNFMGNVYAGIRHVVEADPLAFPEDVLKGGVLQLIEGDRNVSETVAPLAFWRTKVMRYRIFRTCRSGGYAQDWSLAWWV